MEQRSRTGPVRDVPEPRPVHAPPEENRLARAVADAVSGLLGGDGRAGSGSAGSTARDVLAGVASAVGSVLGNRRGPAAGEPAPDAPPAAGTGREPGAVLEELLAAAAPRLPVRDAGRLRAAHPGATDAQIADVLVARASRLTAGIGAATGGLSGAYASSRASLLAVPLELGVESVLTAAVEVVLVGELHELHGRRAPGDARTRGAAYLAAWSAHRSADDGLAGLSSLVGTGMRVLRQRLGNRAAGAVSTAPLLVSAALARRSRRRATELLAARVLRDLRGEA